MLTLLRNLWSPSRAAVTELGGSRLNGRLTKSAQVRVLNSHEGPTSGDDRQKLLASELEVPRLQGCLACQLL